MQILAWAVIRCAPGILQPIASSLSSLCPRRLRSAEPPSCCRTSFAVWWGQQMHNTRIQFKLKAKQHELNLSIRLLKEMYKTNQRSHIESEPETVFVSWVKIPSISFDPPLEMLKINNRCVWPAVISTSSHDGWIKGFGFVDFVSWKPYDEIWWVITVVQYLSP